MRLERAGRLPAWFALLPAMFMIASTGTALVLNFRAFLKKYQLVPQDTSALINLTIAAILFLLGALVVFEALRVWRQRSLETPKRGFEVQMTGAGS